MIPVTVMSVRANHDHAWSVIHTRCHNDHPGRAIAVVVGTRVSGVIGPADYDMAADIGIPKAERHADPRLGGADTGSETEQQSDNDEHAFHGSLLVHP